MKYDLEHDNLIEVCKNASYDELSLLAEDIREFLLNKVSKTGGHLASNLGIVELSIALTRVYDMPQDKIIYDVGHQAYVHKILTGRASRFDTLRQYKGLSGFPKSRESIYDAYDTGHSSTSIGAAYGMALARDLKGEDNEIVAVIGDGSMTGGICYEALNNIGARQTNVKIILNDNGMSISHNVGASSKYLAKIRSSEVYDKTKLSVKSMLHSVPLVGDAIKDGIKNSKENIKHSMLGEQGHLFEDLGITYLGPVDGYNIRDMVDIMKAANTIDGPTIIHVITKKGKGYEWAEKYPRKFHGIGPFDIATGNTLSSSAEPSFSEVFGNKINSIAALNKKVVAIAAAMGTATGLLPFWGDHPDRYYDVGIAEEHAVVTAAGLAKEGYIPVVAIYSSFLQRSFDFIIEDVALQDLHVIFAVDRAGLVGNDGETHHGVFDIAYLNMIPRMTILAPANGPQLEEMLDYAIGIEGPVAIRYPRGTSAITDSRLKPFNGSNIEITSGKDITILSVGNMLEEAMSAAAILREDGYSVGITDVAVIKPLDISWHDLECKLVVTIEDGVVSGGFGSAFNDEYKNDDFDIINIGIPDRFIGHGKVSDLREECGIDGKSIARKVKAYLERKA